jgi:hypothetical protein
VSVSSTLRLLWEGFQASAGKGDLSAHFYKAFHFDDNESSANELAELVLAGRKRATAATLWNFEALGPPRPGSLSMVTDWNGALRSPPQRGTNSLVFLRKLSTQPVRVCQRLARVMGLKAAEMLAKMCGWNEPERVNV